MKRITPLIIGIITGLAMIGVFMWLYSTRQPATSTWQYLIDILYAGGVAWTLLRFTKAANFKPSFKAIFGQGFRCFIAVTFIMVTFTWIFYSAHPEIAKEAAANYREWSLTNEKNILPEQREKNALNYQDRFVITTVYASVFAFLLRGVIFTAAGAAVILMRRRK
jgi:hypothetical protein